MMVSGPYSYPATANLDRVGKCALETKIQQFPHCVVKVNYERVLRDTVTPKVSYKRRANWKTGSSNSLQTPTRLMSSPNTRLQFKSKPMPETHSFSDSTTARRGRPTDPRPGLGLPLAPPRRPLAGGVTGVARRATGFARGVAGFARGVTAFARGVTGVARGVMGRTGLSGVVGGPGLLAAGGTVVLEDAGSSTTALSPEL